MKPLLLLTLIAMLASCESKKETVKRQLRSLANELCECETAECADSVQTKYDEAAQAGDILLYASKAERCKRALEKNETSE